MTSREQKLQELVDGIKKQSFTEGYKATDQEALGILISTYFEWDGLRCLEALGFALENANFHSENEVVQDLIKKLK